MRVPRLKAASLKPGDQIQAEWAPVVGIVYDPKDDVLKMALGGLDHMIPKPREIYVDEGPLGLTSFEAVDADDVRHIVQLREPLMLSATSPA